MYCQSGQLQLEQTFASADFVNFSPEDRRADHKSPSRSDTTASLVAPGSVFILGH